MTDDPLVKVARDLTTIVELATHLADQALHEPNAEIPGGDATVMRGPVANAEAWANFLDHAETEALEADGSWPESYEDPDWEPPLQTLEYWSGRWRVERDEATDLAPTVSREASYLRQILDWAYETEPCFDDFTTEIRKARARLENELCDGIRSSSGAPCLQCGTPLIRIEYDRRPPPSHCPGHGERHDRCPLPHHREGCVDRGGLQDRYRCPDGDCPVTTIGEADYRRAVGQTHLARADKLTAADIERRTGVRPGTVRQWANRGWVRRMGHHPDGRMLYSVDDVETRQGVDACEETTSV